MQSVTSTFNDDGTTRTEQ